MGIIVYLEDRYSGGMHDSKVVWKRLKMKPDLGVHFLFRNEGLIAKVRERIHSLFCDLFKKINGKSRIMYITMLELRKQVPQITPSTSPYKLLRFSSATFPSRSLATNVGSNDHVTNFSIRQAPWRGFGTGFSRHLEGK